MNCAALARTRNIDARFAQYAILRSEIKTMSAAYSTTFEKYEVKDPGSRSDISDSVCDPVFQKRE